MDRYFFNVFDGHDLPDDVGQELTNLAEAKREAVRYAGQLICDAAPTFWNRGDWQMTVTDENGLAMFSMIMTLHDAPAMVSAHRNDRHEL